MRRDWLRTGRAIYKIHRLCQKQSLSPRYVLNLLGEASEELNLTSLHLEYVDFGGVNNAGMFLHHRSDAYEPVALSKIQLPSMAEREFRFMSWSSAHQLRLTAEPIHMARISEISSVISSSFLKKPIWYLPTAVHALHWRLANVDNFAGLGTADSLRQEVSPETPIKNILHNFVSEPDAGSAGLFFEDFWGRRREVLGDQLYSRVLSAGKPLLQRWSELFEKEVGLVHGDFKRQNILCYAEDDYRLIDLQYYLMGMRTWDLSFYYSKYESGFQHALFDYRCANRMFKASDEAVFVLFYLMAVAIKVKPKHKLRVLDTKIVPALEYFERKKVNEQ